MSTSWSEIEPGVRAFLVVLFAAGLAACGFHPLYQKADKNVSAQLAQIDVTAPADELGRGIKYELLDLLTASGNPPVSPLYVLEVMPQVYEQDVAVQQDADVTRKNLLLRTSFRLVEVASGETVYTAKSQTRASYNRLTSEFANLAAAQNAQQRAAKVVAEDIKLKLGVFFSRDRAVRNGEPLEDQDK